MQFILCVEKAEKKQDAALIISTNALNLVYLVRKASIFVF